MPGAFDEERPPLGEERFEAAQVHDRGIRFDLPEVGIHRRRERHAGTQRVLQVRADRGFLIAGRDERVARFRRLRVHLADDIRDELQPLRRLAQLQMREIAEVGDEAVRALRDERPRVGLVEAADLAHDGEPERRIVGRIEAQLREGDAELRAPAVLVARDGDVPHGVPAAVVVPVVGPGAVLLHARGIDAELERRAAIVERVDDDLQPVGRGFGVAPRAQADEPIGLRVVRADRDVEIRGVVHHLHVGREGRRGAVLRIALPEVADGGHLLPNRLGERPIELDRRGGGQRRRGHAGGGRGEDQREK